MLVFTTAWQRLARLSPVMCRSLFRNGRAGAVAIVTAVTAPMLLMIVGFVIDFSYASYTAATAGGGYGNLTFLQNTGVSFFGANTAQLSLTGVNFNLSVTSDGTGGVTATGSYSYNVPTFFAGIIGISSIPVSGTSTTTAHPLVYINYYILVDSSQSMGIAATASEMTRLYNATLNYPNPANGEAGCVFACHDKAVGQTVTNLYIARTASPPIQLRIDAAVTAVKSIISQAQSIAGFNKNIKFALYTIQKDPASLTTLHPIATLSNDYAALQTAASTIDLGSTNQNQRGDSDFLTEFAEFNTALTLSGVLINGVGTSSTSPLNYFIIVTDGVADTYGVLCPAQRCTNALNTISCTSLKIKGTVGVINTVYSPIWQNNNQAANVLESSYNTYVAPIPINGQLKPALQNCATSSDYYFEASDGPDIIARMQSLFQRTQSSSARLTQ